MITTDDATPWLQLGTWLADAIASSEPRPRAFALATVDAGGRPHVRFVDHQPSLAGPDEIAFVTHFGSDKGRELAAVPFAAATFFWPSLGRQLRIEGDVVRADNAASDAYHRRRRRASQLTAWATSQSRPLASREALKGEVARQQARWQGREIPRPEHWGGYRLRPRRVEFWVGDSDRLHHRRLWSREVDGTWRSGWLGP